MKAVDKELLLFGKREWDEIMVKPMTDERRFVVAYKDALKIVESLDDVKARIVWEECENIVHRGQDWYYLKSLANRAFDVIQYTALEDCLLTKVFPSRMPRITAPFAYEIAKTLHAVSSV